MRRKLPEFASGVIITCPAPAFIGSQYACAKEVQLNREQYERGDKGYCDKHNIKRKESLCVE